MKISILLALGLLPFFTTTEAQSQDISFDVRRQLENAERERFFADVPQVIPQMFDLVDYALTGGREVVYCRSPNPLGLRPPAEVERIRILCAVRKILEDIRMLQNRWRDYRYFGLCSIESCFKAPDGCRYDRLESLGIGGGWPRKLRESGLPPRVVDLLVTVADAQTLYVHEKKQY